MKEILGPAAIYFNPASPEDMAEKIHIGITNQQTREKCLELAKKQLEKYSWKTTAKNTLAIYQTYALKSG
jgi:glycosyltransferase involved in cell wall biosynthesis